MKSPSEEAGTLATPTSIMTQGQFEFWTTTEHGIEFKADTPQQEWLSVVEKICGMFEGAEMTKQRALMMLADALNYGQDAYGEQFSQAINGMRQALGLNPKTIANAQSVYKKTEASRRRDGLTLSHYSLLAPLPVNEQEILMDQALSNPKHTMSVAELREEVATIHPKTARGKTRTTKPKPGKETSASALTKLIDVSNYLSEHIDDVNGKWKGPMQKVYRAYRRCFMGSGHKA